MLGLAPDLIELHTNIGLLLVRLGRPDEAVPHFERVLARHPDWLALRLNLVAGLVAAGRLREAVSRLDEGRVRSSPTDLVDAFEQRTRAEPTAPGPWLGLYLAAVWAGDQERARRSACDAGAAARRAGAARGRDHDRRRPVPWLERRLGRRRWPERRPRAGRGGWITRAPGAGRLRRPAPRRSSRGLRAGRREWSEHACSEARPA